jgi:hypothetical protein
MKCLKMDIRTIWRAPKYLRYLQPTLTDEIIKEAENHIGQKLPKEYLELLRIQNGGYIRFTIAETPHSQIYGIGPYFPSITEFEWLKEYDGTLSYELDGLIPFDGDGHWNICLDYRKNKIDPEITYIDTELDYEKSIAKNFQEYLNLLVFDIEGEFIIETESSIEVMVKRISEIAQIDFEEPDYFAHGYPIYRSKYNDSWVWVSPNKVPSAFIREDDNRYTKLKSMMETTSVRYPEISEKDLFISVSDDLQRQELFAKLTEKGIEIKELKDVV